ncbi:MAG: EcoKI restriction-modification system protein HsdS [Firmicutes bacterium ADurb.Bin182]|nr:MAG: EcoKI restriction-modification system protein HsdS [Firmicutes bacterium ADurb.Bin182]HRU78392.1 restriction endonuclease subunit S [Rectinema sp.]
MSKLHRYAFSDLYDMTSGISSTKEQAGHGAPFVSFSTVFNNYFLPDELTDLMDTSEREQEVYSIKKGDILITRTSETVDELAMSCVALKDYPKATYSGFVKRLRPKTEGIAYDKYMAFFLRSKYFRKVINNNTIMTLRASFNEDMFSFLTLYLPDYEEQVKIGDMLYNIERKMRVNNRINDNLQQMAKTIYDYWFTQFDFPNEDGKPYRSSGGQMVWNDELKREIPVGWSSASIVKNSLSTVIKPGVDFFGRKEYLATAEVNGTSISTGSIVEYATRESRANMQPTVNSVWFAKMKNSVKHLYLNAEMQPLIDSTILSTGFCGIQCTELSFEFIASFIESSYFETIKDILAHGATQEAVNNEDMDAIRFAVPTDNILTKYHEATRGMYAQISKNICENRKLTALRDWLLPMLMNGQATVNN